MTNIAAEAPKESQQRSRVADGRRSRILEVCLVVALLGIGLGLRLVKLDEPPLDFQPTRQLRSAIIARGMYYQNSPGADPQLREKAIAIWSTMERYEPPLLEHLVAWTYQLMGGEHLWVARLYSSLFWIIGGIALYGLVRRVFSMGSGLFALGFYLILPWGVQASRVFQPDPWMVMWVLLSAYALYRWGESGARSWLWTVLAGLFAGLAMLVKIMALYAEVCMAAGVLLTLLFEEKPFTQSLRRLLTLPQVWVFAGLSAILPGIYYIGLGQRSTDFAAFWVFSFTGLLGQSKFYVHWLGLIHGIMDVAVFFAAILSALLYPRRARGLMLGLWLGYFLIGISFPYQIYTHDYYSLILVPIVAMSLAPVAHEILNRVKKQSVFWQFTIALVFLSIAGYYTYVARSQLFAFNYKNEPIPWQEMGQKLPNDGTIIALTHDYGNRLKYYGWRTVNLLWPSQADINLSAAQGVVKIDNYSEYFKQQTAGMDYFLVTLFGDLNAQPELKSLLYDHYPIAQQGDGYILFDLRHPKP